MQHIQSDYPCTFQRVECLHQERRGCTQFVCCKCGGFKARSEITLRRTSYCMATTGTQYADIATTRCPQPHVLRVQDRAALRMADLDSS